MYFLGYDIGGTKCAVCLGELAAPGGKLRIVRKERFETAKRDPGGVLDKLYAISSAILTPHGLDFAGVSGIGISCGGPLDAERGVILSPPNLPGWDSIEIVRYFEERTGVRTYLQNDADACAAAEWRFGAGAGCRNMIFLTFGTGLGSGLILNGRPYAGASGMAGEIGHVRMKDEDGGFLPVGYGKRGSAEGFCSGGGIAQLAREAVKRELEAGRTPRLYEAAGMCTENITAKLTAEIAVTENDLLCVSVYEMCGDYLGRTLSVLIDILNPELIVLGGIYMRSSELLIPKMKESIKREALSASADACRIVPAALGEEIGDYAAISVAVNKTIPEGN